MCRTQQERGGTVLPEHAHLCNAQSVRLDGVLARITAVCAELSYAKGRSFARKKPPGDCPLGGFFFILLNADGEELVVAFFDRGADFLFDRLANLGVILEKSFGRLAALA